MAKHIQIRNVPEELHRKLKSKAALEGHSLSEYLLRELRELAAYPSLEEFFEMLEKHEPVELPEGFSAADLIREDRDNR